jgi:hypothetical protein
MLIILCQVVRQVCSILKFSDEQRATLHDLARYILEHVFMRPVIFKDGEKLAGDASTS